MDINKFNAKELEALRKEVAKADYEVREWITDDKYTCNLAEYAEYFNPDYKNCDSSVSPEIITKETKEGKEFLTARLTFNNGRTKEYPLSYAGSDFEEGDLLDWDTVTFCRESWSDKNHWYITGEVL